MSSFNNSDSFHPFSFYDLGKPQSWGNTHSLRKYPNVLWEIRDFGLPTEKGVRKVCNNYGVREYPLDKEERDELMREVEKNSLVKESQQKKLLEIAKPLSGHRSRIDFHPQETCAVLQHEYAITTSNSIKPVLATYGAGPCLIIAIYDEESKKAVLTHVDSATHLDSLNRLLKMMNPSSSSVHLCGGDMSSQDMCMDIVELIESNGFKISNSDIVRSGFCFDSASLAIDARTGSIYSPVSPKHLETGKDQEIRLQMAGMVFGKSAVRVVYDGSLPTEQKKAEISAAVPIAPRNCTEFFRQNLERAFKSPSGPGLYPDK